MKKKFGNLQKKIEEHQQEAQQSAWQEQQLQLVGNSPRSVQ
jgi:hypothetical protein